MAHDAGNRHSTVNYLVANAESWDPTQTDFISILFCATAIAVVCGMVATIMLLAKRMGHPQVSLINIAVMFWGLIAAGSIFYVTVTQLKWAKENFLELLSGYADPRETGPELPWPIWGVLLLIYASFLFWTLRKKN